MGHKISWASKMLIKWNEKMEGGWHCKLLAFLSQFQSKISRQQCTDQTTKRVRSPRKVARIRNLGGGWAQSVVGPLSPNPIWGENKYVTVRKLNWGTGSVAFIPVYWPTSEGLCPPDWSRSPAQREFQIWHTEEPMFIGFHCLGETGSKMRPPPFQTLIKGESLDIGNWNTQNTSQLTD